MRKILTLAVALSASAFAGHQASAFNIGSSGAAAPMLTPVGSDGASLPGAPGGKGGKPGKPVAGYPGMMTEAQARKLYDYCIRLMDDMKRGKDMGRDNADAFAATDCAGLFMMQAAEPGQPGRGGDGASLPGAPGGKGGKAGRIPPVDAADEDAEDADADRQAADDRKRDGAHGPSIAGGVGGKGGKAGSGVGGGSGGSGGAGVAGGSGGKGGKGGNAY